MPLLVTGAAGFMAADTIDQLGWPPPVGFEAGLHAVGQWCQLQRAWASRVETGE